MKQQALLTLSMLLLTVSGFGQTTNNLTGTWQRTDTAGASVRLLIADNYLMQTTFTPTQFVASRGGGWQRTGGRLQLLVDFDTQDSSRVGQSEAYTLSVSEGRLTMTGPTGNHVMTRVIESTPRTPLTGLWRITDRISETGQRTTMQTGPRRTIKLLTGSRFQWAAINPATRQFMGTGGGTYLTEGNQYTETIDFFSRDNSRVGRSLAFTVNLTGSDWQHTGKSSTGGAVNEIWSREN